MFRANMCPSSGEFTVSMRHWYFSLCVGGCLVCWLGWVSITSASLYNLFQMKPTRCTLLLSIFISTSLHVLGQICAHHQENLLYLCDTGIFHYVWVAVWSTGWDETGLIATSVWKRLYGNSRSTKHKISGEPIWYKYTMMCQSNTPKLCVFYCTRTTFFFIFCWPCISIYLS